MVGERPYAFDMGGGFVPYRLDVDYTTSVREVPIRELAAGLDFVARHANWGMLARRGHFEIGAADLRRIADAMGVDPAISSASSIAMRPSL